MKTGGLVSSFILKNSMQIQSQKQFLGTRNILNIKLFFLFIK